MKIRYDETNDQILLCLDLASFIYVNMLNSEGEESNFIVYKQSDPAFFNAVKRCPVIGELYG